MILLDEAVPQWAVPVVSAFIIIVVTIAFVLKKKISNKTYNGEKVDYIFDESAIVAAELDYSELQRNLTEGVHALENVRDNVQTLFSGVHGAQILHSEVENCVNSLAEEIEISASSESTVSELEKLLEIETRNRWALTVTHEKELKAISSKCAVFEIALKTARDKFDLDLAVQQEAFENIIREKEDEMKILEGMTSDQKCLLSDLQCQLDKCKLEIESLKIENTEDKKTIENVIQSNLESAELQTKLKQEIEDIRSKLLLRNEEIEKRSTDLSTANNNIELLSITAETYKFEHQRLQHMNEQSRMSCQEYECKLSELRADMERLRTVSDEKESLERRIADLESQILQKADEVISVKDELAASSSEADKLKNELGIAIEKQENLLRELRDLRSTNEMSNNASASEITRLQSEIGSFQDQRKDLQDQLEKLQYELNTRVDDLAYKDTALKEALTQAEQFRNEQKKLTDTQLEISLMETEQRIRDIQLAHDQELFQLKEVHVKIIDEVNIKNRKSEQEITDKRQEEITALKLEVLEANKSIELLNDEIAQLNAELKDSNESVIAVQKHYSELQLSHQATSLNFELQIVELKKAMEIQERNWNADKLQSQASAEQNASNIAVLRAELEKLQQENCILSNALLDEACKHKTARDELSESRRLSDVLKEQYQVSRIEEEQTTLARIEEALQQKTSEFESTTCQLIQNYEKQIGELNEELSCYKNQDEDAEQRERAFAETLQESLAAVNKSKKSEIASICQEYKKDLAAKEAQLDAARLDFQSKLTCANKALEQQSKSFEERLRAELDAQTACSSKRLEFSELTISKLQEELQRCRAVINDLNAQVKISKFKADGAGVLLDRVHSYKTQLACSDQEKSELLHSLESRDKDLKILNEKIRDNELVIQEFEYAIREYEIELKNRVEALNLIHSTYILKLSYLESCFDQHSEQQHQIQENLANLNNEEGFRQQIEQLKMAIENQQADFTTSLNTIQASSLEKMMTIEEFFEKEKASIMANRDELSNILQLKSQEIEDLHQKLGEKKQEIVALNGTLEHRISEITQQFESEKKELNDKHQQALQIIKLENERQISQLLETSKAEQSVMIEKAKTETAKEWQAIINSSEAMFQEKLQTVVEATRSVMQVENDSAIQNAIEHEKEIAQERHQNALKELQELSESRMAEVNNVWKAKFDSQSSLIESLQTKLDQFDRFHKPKSKTLLGQRDPLTGSRPGASDGSVKRSKQDAKENASNGGDINGPGQSSESSKTVSSRGSRSRSRRDSQGHRYWKASDFQLRSELGQGTYGTHYLAIEHKTSTQYAINKISRRKIEKSNSANILIQRIEIMGQLTHPYIRRMLGSFEDDRWIYIVQEYIPNSKLLSNHLQDLLLKKYVFPPSDVAFLMTCLANALDYIHSKQMVHCQVAVDKILLTANGTPKLAGPTIGITSLPVPPPEYLVGESSASLSWTIDSWSLGVLAFTLLVGRIPFSVSDNVVDLNLVADEAPVFSSHSDPLAKSLIESLLCKDPSMRPSMSQVLLHPFIVHYQKKEPLSTIREDQRL